MYYRFLSARRRPPRELAAPRHPLLRSPSARRPSHWNTLRDVVVSPTPTAGGEPASAAAESGSPEPELPRVGAAGAPEGASMGITDEEAVLVREACRLLEAWGAEGDGRGPEGETADARREGVRLGC